MLRNLLGSGGVLLVLGEAGIGKTRLLAEYEEVARNHDLQVVWGRPELVSEIAPYAVIIDVLQNLGRGIGDTPEQASLLSALIDQPDELRRLPARQVAARVRGLLGDLGPRPVLFLEDLHLADEPSQAVVAHLARSAQDDGAVVVCSMRPEEELSDAAMRLLEVLEKDHLAERIDLAPLPVDAVREMLEAIRGDMESDMAQRVIELSEGVPFFVEELAATTEDLPGGVARATDARLRRLSREGQRFMRVASLGFGALDPRVLCDVTSHDHGSVSRYVAEGISAGILADREGKVVFRHRLLQEAIRASLMSLEVPPLHEAFAQAIERRHEADIDRYANRLAAHYEAAGAKETAARYLILAGERALRAGSIDEAVDTLDRALTGPLSPDDRVRGILALAQAHLQGGRADRSTTILKAELTHQQPPGEAELRVTLGEHLLEMGDGEALRVLRGVALGEGDSELQPRLLLGISRAKHHEGLVDSAELEQELQDVFRRGSPVLRARAALELSQAFAGEGRPDKADHFTEEAIRHAREGGSLELVGIARSRHATRLALAGEGEEAIRLLEDVRGDFSATLSSHLAIQLDHVLCWILWRMGRPEEADRFAARVEASGGVQRYARVVRIWSALERNNESGAQAQLKAWWGEIGEQFRIMPIEELRGLPSAPTGGAFALLADALVGAFGEEMPVEEALRAAARYDEFASDGIPDAAAQGALLHARALLRAEETAVSENRVNHALRLCDAGAGVLQRGIAAELLGRIDTERGRPDRAIDHLQHACAALEEAGNQSDRARCARLLARLLDRDESIPLLRTALKLATESGAKKEQLRIEADLRELGVRPRAGRPKGSTRRRKGLSGREEEVVTLVASGATNAEIAARLFISDRTVQDHIRNAQRHVGVTGRAGLAAWAAKQGLI